jgi:anti-anti-sigma factor
MHHLRISTERMQDYEIVQLAGAIDALNFAGVAAVLDRTLAAAAARVILDCRAVSYISSTGLRELLDFARTARALGGDLKCVGLSPTIAHVVDLIANGDALECLPSINDALAAFRDAPLAVAC